MAKHWSEYPYPEQNKRYRWNWASPRWWRPVMKRSELASGSFGGWYLWWGPFRVWNFVTHNKTKEKGLTWR